MSPVKPTTAILHYTAPPIIGGVEGVMDAHARIFLQMRLSRFDHSRARIERRFATGNWPGDYSNARFAAPPDFSGGRDP